MIMELWPFIPQSGMTESLEWLTNVIRAKAGEDRISLRHYPRQTYDIECWLSPEEYGRAKIFCRENYEGFYFPMWQHHVNVAALTFGDSVIPGDYSSGVWLGKIVVWDNSIQWEIAEVTSVSGELVLSGDLSKSYLRPVICPIQEVNFSQSSDFKLSNDDIRVGGFRFRSIRGTQLESDADYPQHRGIDVLTDPNILSGQLTEQHSRDVDEIDAGVGIIEVNPIYSQAETETIMKWETINKVELLSTLEWVHTRRGRKMPFWYMSHNSDLVPISALEQDPDNAAKSRIRISAINKLSAPFDIAIIHESLGEDYYRVESVVEDGSGQYIYLDRDQGKPWDNSLISISLLVGVRFKSDRVEIKYGNGGAAKIAVPLIEVPGL